MSVKKIDCLSELCPIPLLKTIKELRSMKPKEILLIEADHSCVAIDLEKWAKDKGYPIKIIEVDKGQWEIYIQKPDLNK